MLARASSPGGKQRYTPTPDLDRASAVANLAHASNSKSRTIAAAMRLDPHRNITGKLVDEAEAVCGGAARFPLMGRCNKSVTWSESPPAP